MGKPSIRHIKKVYESFPFPSGGTPHLVSHWTNLIEGYVRRNGIDMCGKDFLDAGCGTGDNAINFASIFPQTHFLGVDLSSTSISVACQSSAEKGIANIGFACADLMNFRFRKKFDIISVLGVLHHTPSPLRCLKNLMNALKPGGTIFADVYGSYGYLSAARGQEMINILEPDFAKLDERLCAMEWVAEFIMGRKPPSGDRQNPFYIALVDGFLSPISENYKILDAIDLFKKGGVKKLEWLDAPKLHAHAISYTNSRGETADVPIPADAYKKLSRLKRDRLYRFFELTFMPFDLFFAGK